MEFFKKQRTLIDLMKTKHVATFVFVSIAALFLAEFVLRGLVLLMPVETDLVFGTLPKVGIATDVKGFPNKEVLMTANIVVFGDSMTIGPTVTRLESWPQVVAKLATTSVYSMAVGGYGPVQYAAQLDQALLLRPKVVVVGFYFASDMIDAYTMAYENEYWKSLRDPAFVSARIPTAGRDCGTSVGSQSVQLHCSIAKWNTWLKAKLRVYLRLGDITRGLRVTGSAFIEKKSANTIVMVNDPRMGTVGISTEHQHLFDISEPSVREGWRITRMLFTGMKKRAAGHGARFVVVIIPTKVELYAEY
ncbi:MAG: SGNH/GDSL hydrolase family protein, partial [bacterium]|nr:SGNH/GDSL hydrolase family protein [bacterium]